MNLEEISNELDSLGRAWAEFKAANDDQRGRDEQKLGKLNDTIDRALDRLARLETTLKRPTASKGGEPDWKTTEEGKSFLAYMRKGDQRLEPDERKALSVGNDPTAGYLAPVAYSNEIVKGVTEISPFRSLARVTPISTRSLIIPKRTGQFAARRVSELGTRSETEGLQYGQLEIVAPEMFAEVHVSQQLREDAAVDMDAEIRSEMVEQFAVKEGYEFISGNGAEECEGILSASGVTEVASGAAAAIAHASSAEADGLIDLSHAIKSNYARSATWLLNRSTLRDVRKLKDTNEQYVWQPGLALGTPSTILGAPYSEMPDMPDVAAGTYPVAFGDWRRAYRIADRVQMALLSDPYTLAGSGLHKFLGRKRVGGKVTLSEAYAKLKIATSV